MRTRRSDFLVAVLVTLLIGTVVRFTKESRITHADAPSNPATEQTQHFAARVNVTQHHFALRSDAHAKTERRVLSVNQSLERQTSRTDIRPVAYAHSGIQALRSLPTGNLVQAPEIPTAPTPPTLPDATISEPGRFTVSGTISISGDLPSERALPLDSVCAANYARRFPGRAPTTRFFVTEDGGLGDVFVTVLGIESPANEVELPKHTITQEGCWLSPYVSACRTGQTIQFISKDDSLFSLMSSSRPNSGNPVFHATILPGAPPIRTSFAEPEEFLRFKSDINPWMFAYVSLVDHPYFAITSPKGNYSIPDLPPGTYQIKARHRKAGALIQDLTITDSDATVAFNFAYVEED